MHPEPSPTNLGASTSVIFQDYSPAITAVLFILAYVSPLILPSKKKPSSAFTINVARHRRLLILSWIIFLLFVS